ncbi:MAG: Hsp20 family protein, partial [Bacteroidales bacterium]|nr:Hsp20 family protein [Bacteroidales bacterium]
KQKITAKMEHGVLTIDIPKTEPQKPVDTSRQIEIQ